jgi:hypothetical protein
MMLKCFITSFYKPHDWLASRSSVQPIMASPSTHILIEKLNKSYQTSPKVINAEDGNCKIHQNVGEPSTFDTA